MDDLLSFNQAVAMDAMLNMLIQKTKEAPGCVMGPNRFASSLKIDEDEAKHLIVGIAGTTFHGDTIVHCHGEEYPEIEKKYNTEEFLTSGGFTKMYKYQLIAIEEEKEDYDKNEILREGQIKQLTIDRNQYILAIIVAVSGWLAFFITLFLQLKGLI